MKTIIINMLFLCLATSVMAQTPLENAEYLYEDKNYVDAAKAYESIVEKIKNPRLKSEVYGKIGNSYYLTDDFKNAETWYKKAIDGGLKSGEVFMNYGEIKMYFAEYPVATSLFEKAKAADSTTIRLADIRIVSANTASKKEEYPSVIIHSNLKELNTNFPDYGPAMMSDNKLVFSSSRKEGDAKIDKTSGQGFSRLYYASEQNGTWKLDGKLPESVNSPYNNGTFSYHQPSGTGYFTVCNGYDGKGKTCKIYTSQYDAGANTWSKPEALSFNSDEFDCAQPSISADGNVLYFSSDKPGGYGQKDLYKSIKGVTRLWGDPINLGKEINSPGDDVFPTISGDSLFIYSSDGRQGLGGLDLYKATFVKGNPKNPEWMEMPFNSTGDDFNLVYGKTKEEGFYCSNRIGGFGNDDIYAFKMDDRYKTISGFIREDKTNLPVTGAKVILQGTDGSKMEAITDNTGKFTITNGNPQAAYRILGTKTGYFSNSVMIPAIDFASKENPEEKLSKRNNAEVALVKITKEEIKLDNIYYAYNSAELTESSKTELMTLVKLLNETPDVNIVLNAHTDEQGSDKYNFQLSDKRAKSVKDFLMANGISETRLSSKGWGESSPLFKNAKTEEENAANRRTTFQVTNLKAEN
jgi:peptidoglycan-associated lipoprotein